MKHKILLGDSTYDNAAYTEGGPSVVDQLTEVLRPGWRERDYLDALMVVQEADCPIAVCTIYNGNFQPGIEQTAISTAVRLFNDSIVRLARTAACNVLELRDACTDASDYANPIEPSSVGGAKIAAAIADLAHVFADRVATQRWVQLTSRSVNVKELVTARIAVQM